MDLKTSGYGSETQLKPPSRRGCYLKTSVIYTMHRLYKHKLPVLLLTFIAHSGLGASDEARRQEHNHRLSSILVHNNRASSLLSRFLGHEFAIPEEALRRGNNKVFRSDGVFLV